MSHLKFRDVVIAALAIVTLLAAPASTYAAPQAAASGDFCKGIEALIFSPENPLPSSAPCPESSVSLYTLVEPWRAGCEGSASDPDCNVGFRLTDSWERISEWLASHKFDRGSVWANPKEPAAPPEGTPAYGTPAPEATPAPLACTAPSGSSLSAGLAIQDPNTGTFHTCMPDGSFDPPFPTPEATTAPATQAPPTDGGVWNWGWCLWPLAIAALAGLIFLAVRWWRNRRPAAPRPPTPPAP